MTQTATIAAPAPLGTDVAAGPLTIRLEEAIVADGNATVANTNQQNAEPPAGLAYVLARLTVANTGGQRATITVDDFAATGTDGILRRCPSIALPADPLNATIEPGASATGWTASLVNDLSSVVMLFDPAIAQGARYAASFALTDGAALPALDPSGEPTDAGTALDSPAAVGEAVRTATWEVTVNDAIGSDAYYEISDYRVRALGTPGPGADSWLAVGLDLTVRNVATTPQFFSWSGLELIDTNGEPWDHLLAMTQPLPPASVELLPGASVRGWYGIWLWDWATTSLLRFRDSKLSDDFRYIDISGTAGGAQQPRSQSTASQTPQETPAEPLNLTPGDTAQVGADPLNLRSEASVNGSIVAELKPGTQVAITGAPVEAESYTWYPVEVIDTGQAGFVAEGFLVPAGG